MWWKVATEIIGAILIASVIFFLGYRYGSRDCVAVNSPTKVAAAQHAVDAKQHQDAVLASQSAAENKAVISANTAEKVKIIHTAPKIITVPIQCPADPPVDADVLKAYNQAGH